MIGNVKEHWYPPLTYWHHNKTVVKCPLWCLSLSDGIHSVLSKVLRDCQMIDPYCQTKFYVSQIDNVETVDCMHYDFNLPKHLAMTCQIKNKYHTYGDFHLSWSFFFYDRTVWNLPSETWNEYIGLTIPWPKPESAPHGKGKYIKTQKCLVRFSHSC